MRTPVSASGSFLISIALLFLGFLLFLGLQNRIPIVFVAFYAFISLVAFVVYAADKAAARQGAWRTKESTLHLLALFCGWPGALIAQQVFRHKTKKEDFVFIFWVTVVANCALLAVLVSPAGRSLYASTVP